MLRARKARRPALVIFGRDEGGRPHASTFTAVEAELAETAAGHMAMWVLHLTGDEHRAAASELPAGRIFSSGKGFVPFCKETAYTRLQALEGAFQPQPAAEPEPPEYSHVPSRHDDIAVGALVLACEVPKHGFFESVVIGAPDDDLLELRWLAWPALAPFVRRRAHVALTTEDLVEAIYEAEAATPDAQEGAAAA